MISIISSTPLNSIYSDIGNLKVSVTDENNIPIPDAKISISFSGAPTSILEELETDESGQTDTLPLGAPPLDLSLNENNNIQPYSQYTLSVTADNYESVNVNGIQILSTTTAFQNVALQSSRIVSQGDVFIPAHTLFGDYPPKIAEAEIKPLDESGEIVLRDVVIPEYVIVHDGPPSDSGAANTRVLYTDYIKNVASSEIYATWPIETIYANILCIMSFTLNRVFTEWYPSKGYDFTITSSTAYDQKWIRDRNIFDSISAAVDDIFANYLSRPNVLQPIFAQYCDGKSVTCPQWLSQWGSKSLGEDGLSAIEILRYYYGDSIYVNTANQVSGIPASYPGAPLDIGSSGDSVLQIQEQLNEIRKAYPLIPRLSEDGVYGESTKQAVTTFQRIFDLTPDGIVGRRTWYKISQLYVGVTKIAESPQV